MKLDHSLTIVNTESSNSCIFRFKDFTGQPYIDMWLWLLPSHTSVEMGLLGYLSQLCEALKDRFQKTIPSPKSHLHVHQLGKISAAQCSDERGFSRASVNKASSYLAGGHSSVGLAGRCWMTHRRSPERLFPLIPSQSLDFQFIF